MTKEPSIKFNEEINTWEMALDSNKAYLSHEAIDFYHRYKENLELMKGMGFNSFRTGIAWGRFFPNGDETKPNEVGLKFYEDMVDIMLEMGMELRYLIMKHHYIY